MEPHVAKERIATGYARLYGPLAVVSVVIAFQPILEGAYGTLWETAARPAGGPAAVGLMMMFGLVVALAWATLRPRDDSRPAGRDRGLRGADCRDADHEAGDRVGPPRADHFR